MGNSVVLKTVIIIIPMSNYLETIFNIYHFNNRKAPKASKSIPMLTLKMLTHLDL